MKQTRRSLKQSPWRALKRTMPYSWDEALECEDTRTLGNKLKKGSNTRTLGKNSKEGSDTRTTFYIDSTKAGSSAWRHPHKGMAGRLGYFDRISPVEIFGVSGLTRGVF